MRESWRKPVFFKTNEKCSFSKSSEKASCTSIFSSHSIFTDKSLQTKSHRVSNKTLKKASYDLIHQTFGPLREVPSNWWYIENKLLAEVYICDKKENTFFQTQTHTQKETVQSYVFFYMKIIVISRMVKRTRWSITVGDDFDIWISLFDSIIEHNIVPCNVVILL